MPNEILRPPRGWQLRETTSKVGKVILRGPGTEMALKAGTKILQASAEGSWESYPDYIQAHSPPASYPVTPIG